MMGGLIVFHQKKQDAGSHDSSSKIERHFATTKKQRSGILKRYYGE
jgi:hypothetical protein